ncbi:MAG: hypothetical protein ACFFDI_30185, partial [Promethearchaeota archaeon]
GQAYIAYSGKGFDIFDVSLLPAVQKVNSYRANVDSVKIVLIDDLCYILSAEGILIFDVSDISNIKRLGKYTLRFQGDGTFKDFKIVDNTAYAARYVTGFEAPFVIFDITDPNNPAEIFPTTISQRQRTFWLITIILGYIIAPVVIVSISTLISVIILKERRKKKRNNVQENTREKQKS